jgi:uncharacterized membrane protein YgdD (TMEM256/DUF423 family)
LADGHEQPDRAGRRWTGRLGADDPRLFLAALLLAAAIHAPIFGNALNPDAVTALASAQNLWSHGSPEAGTLLVPRHPPAQAAGIIPFALVLGFSEPAVHAFELATFLADLAALWFLGKAFAPRFAIMPVLFFAVDPIVYQNMAEGRGLVLIALFSILTLAGVLKGIEDRRYLVLAGAGASLAFLTADTVGWLVLVGAGCGLVWRIRYDGIRILRDRFYLAAGGIFALTVAAWSWYNLRIIGSVYTDPRIPTYITTFALSEPTDVRATLASGYAVYFGLDLLVVTLPFLLIGSWREALRRLPRTLREDQRAGALALFVTLSVSIGALAAAALTREEPLRSLDQGDTYLRYAAVASFAVYLGLAYHLSWASRLRSRRSLAMGGRLAMAGVLAVGLLAAQIGTEWVEIQGPTEAMSALRHALARDGISVAYSEVALLLRYNVPTVAFREFDLGYSTPTVTVNGSVVPPGSALVTLLYVPPHFDAQVGSYYLIRHFDPANESVMVNRFHA